MLKTEYESELRFIFKQTYDPSINYWVSPPANIDGSEDYLDGEDPWISFIELLVTLSFRKLTGDAARTATKAVLYSSDKESRVWMSRILGRDLKIGASYGTIERLFPKEKLIEFFGLQLCDAWNPAQEITRPMMVDWKMDGVRCLIFCDNDGNLSVMSRNGKPLFNFDLIFEELRKSDYRGYVLDGEIVGKNFNKSSSAKAKNDSSGMEDLVYYAWDILPYDEWMKGTFNDSQFLRRKLLDTFVRDRNLTRVIHLEWWMAKNHEELNALSLEASKLGKEGVIVKDPDAKYFFGRDARWAKYKPRFTDTFKIVGFYEGNGRLAGTLGGLYVEGEPREYFDFHSKYRSAAYELNFSIVKSKCGSGFDDAMRRAIWDKRDKYLGMSVELFFDSVTPDASLRFPIFRRFRNDE